MQSLLKMIQLNLVKVKLGYKHKILTLFAVLDMTDFNIVVKYLLKHQILCPYWT